MGDDYQEKARILVGYLGGKPNIVSVTNCMTRLRTVVREESAVDEARLKSLDDVLGLVHDREGFYEIVVGPGKSRKYADGCRFLGLPSAAGAPAKEGAGPKASETDNSWKEYKEGLHSSQKSSRLKSALKLVGDIFVPLIPGIIAAGLCAGIGSLIAQAVPDHENIKAWSFVYSLLALVNQSLMTYLTAWAGYRAAERFGATPILGGMLGMITSLDGINQISRLLGMYQEASPLDSILRTGKGGVLAVIAGVFLLSAVEKKIRSRMPESLDIIATPLLSLLFCAVPYILVIMPMFGYISGAVVWVFTKLCMSGSLVVRLIAGYASAALFLPLVAAGMHHGLVALYSVQLQELGYVTLYPALAMAGAGQVGASLALWLKARRVGNRKLCSVIAGALPAGLLGVGEPLIYGVTLPLGKPFITAGLGAGFGGALVMAMQVAATTWGPSGLLGIFVMTAGPRGAAGSVLMYVAGLAVSYICSFVITGLAIDKRTLLPEAGETSDPASSGKTSLPDTARTLAGEALKPGGYHTVRHGDTIWLGGQPDRLSYTLTDSSGMHARPAGKLATLAKKYPCDITITVRGKRASAKSPIELMGLGAGQGDVLEVQAEGEEAGSAISAIKEFLRQNL